MKLFMVRRVVGDSMSPTLRQGQIVIARYVFRQLRKGQVVVVGHKGLEKIKRIAAVNENNREVYVVGDNPQQSTDSRQFGWLPMRDVRAIVIWPKRIALTSQLAHGAPTRGAVFRGGKERL